MAGNRSVRRLRAVVSGRVQGVFYRLFVLRTAQQLRLGGRVRNLRDGRVEVEAEGDEPQLRELLRHLRQGPPGAVVDSVEEEWEEGSPAHRDFQIDYS